MNPLLKELLQRPENRICALSENHGLGFRINERMSRLRCIVAAGLEFVRGRDLGHTWTCNLVKQGA